ncbi:unnamed protein product [Notodromas monacha]|uniref:Bacterial surface antigen (D15) domain-containing protein n=1 Tax=Notodromas monacha TaxID=399045 RepID=A0A7R9GB80_9CRUS|nr:unnamed protein product [Notodromas monacha]CAG0914796.1 unnamed protein product [Notodromas monacha]
MGVVHAKSKTPGDEIIETRILDTSSLKARVDRIHVQGLQRTKDDFVQAAVAPLMEVTEMNNLFLTVNEVRNTLGQLACFKSVAVGIDVSGTTPDGVEVWFYVEELKRHRGGFKAQGGNNEGSCGIGFDSVNFKGRGEKASFSYEYGTRKTASFALDVSKPLVDLGCSKLAASAFSTNSISPSSLFRLTSRGLSLGLDLFPFWDVQHRVSWDGCWRDLNCMSIDTPFSVREEAGHSLKSGLRYSVSKDSRDSKMLPTEGTLWRLSSEASGFGGDVGFLQHGFDYQANFRVLGNLVGQVGLSGNVQYQTPWQTSMSLKAPQICDRCFMGGPLDVRGFRINGAGPHADAAALGASTKLAYGAHIYFPMPGISHYGFSDSFRFHAFATAGHIGELQEKPNFEELRHTLRQNLRASCGIGMVLRLGDMARLELNYALPMIWQNGDQRQRGFQLGIGVDYL